VTAAAWYPAGYTPGMSVTTMKIQAEVRDRLARVAADDYPGVSLSEAVDRLLSEHERERTRGDIAAAYARLRADTVQWSGYVVELDEWDGVTADEPAAG
jgi:hypothetical protein